MCLVGKPGALHVGVSLFEVTLFGASWFSERKVRKPF